MTPFLRRVRRIIPILLLIFALCAGLCFFLAFCGEYDGVIHHFLPDALCPRLAVIFLAAGGVTAALGTLAVRVSKSSLTLTDAGTPVVFLSTLVGFLLFASFIIDIRSLMDAGAHILSRLLPALRALAAIHFIAQAARKADAPRTAGTGAIALLPMVYAFAQVLDRYFDTAYAMNAPVKTLEMMTYLSMALFFTAEARAVLHRERWMQTLFFGGICGVLSTAMGLAEILTMLSGARVPSFALMDGAVMLAVGLLALVRLFSARVREAETDDKTE